MATKLGTLLEQLSTGSQSAIVWNVKINICWSGPNTFTYSWSLWQGPRIMWQTWMYEIFGRLAHFNSFFLKISKWSCCFSDINLVSTENKPNIDDDKIENWEDWICYPEIWTKQGILNLPCLEKPLHWHSLLQQPAWSSWEHGGGLVPHHGHPDSVVGPVQPKMYQKKIYNKKFLTQVKNASLFILHDNIYELNHNSHTQGLTVELLLSNFSLHLKICDGDLILYF